MTNIETTIAAAIAHLHTRFQDDETVVIDTAAEQAIADYIRNGDANWTVEEMAQHHEYVREATIEEVADAAYAGVFPPKIEPRRLYNDETLTTELYDL